eukprot:2083696-Ditylum_brightwellii.AAC.1
MPGDNTMEYYQRDDEGAGSPASIQTAKRSGSSNSTAIGSAKREGLGTRGTRTIIGTSTPIHLPRAASSPSSSNQQQQRDGSRPQAGTPASVFRGRPGGARGRGSSAGSSSNNNEPPHNMDENSPQKLLLSLRTPTKSFDDGIVMQHDQQHHHHHHHLTALSSTSATAKLSKRSNVLPTRDGSNQPPPE